MKQLIPNAFADGILDFNKLKQILAIENQLQETNLFGLNWNGKNQAINHLRQMDYSLNLKPNRSESLNFDQANNIIIEGDNLKVMKILEKAYFEQVDVIYIDPPYNTGNEFVYHDDFKQSVSQYQLDNQLIDEQGLKTTTNSKTSGRFHTNWLNMIYPRLLIARNLLKQDGMIFISIDDHEYAHLKMICDEIFGSHNFITTLIWQKKNSGSGDDTKHLKKLTEYILMYAKNETQLNVNKMVRNLEQGNYKESDQHEATRGKYSLNQLDRASLTWSEKLDYEIMIDNQIFYPGGVTKEQWLKRKTHHAIKDWRWRWSKPKLEWGLLNDFIVVKNNKIYSKQYQFVDNENQPIARQSPFSNLILNQQISGTSGTEELKQLFANQKVFDHPKPIDLIKYLVNLHPAKDALVLDFFAGSASTAHAVMDLNQADQGTRKYVLIQLPELVENSAFTNIAQIARMRVKNAIKIHHYQNQGFKYFQLASTNFPIWNVKKTDDVTTIANQLTIFEEPSNSSNDYESMLYELMIKQGMRLDENIQLHQIDDYQFWADEFFDYLFFLKPTKPDNLFAIIKKIIENKEQEGKTRIYINETYFDDLKGDEIKLNLAEQINQYKKESKKEIQLVVV